MVICGNVRAVPVVTVNDVLPELMVVLLKPDIVSVSEISVTLWAPIEIPEVPSIVAMTKLSWSVYCKSPPLNPAARLTTLFPVLASVA